MKKIAILPKLYDANGDIRKQWFVYYSFRDPATDKMKRFKVFEGLSDKNLNKKERYIIAEILINDLTARMRQGWNPFAESTEFLFENNLLPRNTAKISAAEAGVPMYHIQKQNGHASLRSTEVYMKNKIGFTSEQIKTQFPPLDEPYINQRNFMQN